MKEISKKQSHSELPSSDDLKYINAKLVELKAECEMSKTHPHYLFNNSQFNVLMSFYFQSCSLVLWNKFSNCKITDKTDAFDGRTDEIDHLSPI